MPAKSRPSVGGSIEGSGILDVPPIESSEPPKIKRNQVTLDSDLAQMVGVIAAAMGVRIQDWVNSRLRPVAERELTAAMESMGLEVKPKPKK